MNGTNDVNQTVAGEGAAGFCQNCGRPLTVESRRVVGTAVYCEPCLEARLGGGVGGYGPVGGVIPSGVPNPGLAALLGLIPGVGAMYNEQYAKGIVHLVIFAVLVSFTHISDVFVLFVLGWIAYMSIEAHHTARARRDGTMLPNPFGLNDIGERMGFGRAWPQGADVGAVVRDAAAAAGFPQAAPGYGASAANAASTRAGFGGPAAPAGAAADPSAAAGAGWGAPVDAYPAGAATSAAPAGTAGYTQSAGQVPGSQVHGGQGYPPSPGYGPGYVDAGYAGVPYGAGYPAGYNTQNPYGAPFVPPVTPVVPPASRFPAGAVWLIGLGTIFLLGTTGLFHGISGLALVGFALIGLGVWNFVRRMTDTGLLLSDDGTPMYRLRLVRAVESGVWLVVVGVLVLLDTFDLLHWRYSWPWLVILGGVLMLLKRAAYSMAAPVMPAAWSGEAAPAPVAPMASTSTGIVPSGVSAPLMRNDVNDSDVKQGGN